ncbi:MAG TPA: non-ribosomal peptide synthetase [Candidatus Stackebrandtia faecavium]|nr:non-ribosomal peptide synthetase [Candidatus Stackebrandtia faecavium]
MNITTQLAPRTVFDAIARHAQSQATAVIHNGIEWTYAELLGRAYALARVLGPNPGPVGVVTSHSPNTIVALLGVWAAGGTYCPIDPAFPQVRQQEMVAAAECTNLVLTESHQDSPTDIHAIAVPTEQSPPVEAVGSAGPAYILFTSGSTGTPKPVETSHVAIAATVASLRDLFDVSLGDRVLQFASLNWDTCFEEILPTLSAGAAVVFDDDAHTGSFPRLLRLLARHRVTVADLPTAYWHELVRYLDDEGTTVPDCFRLMIIGGEAASPARLRQWDALGNDRVRLLNTYGCTETTLITHAADLGSFDTGPVPIGYPLPHVVQHIDDGELLIGGPALATGYVHNNAETDRKFVWRQGQRFFRTGDAVTISPSGALIHNGRIDAELKIRGIKVNPVEVEALIGAHRDVSAVAVVGTQHAGRTALLAYLVPADNTDSNALAATVARDLRSRAPSHLVPARIITVDALAHTPSGKVDRALTHRRHTSISHLGETMNVDEMIDTFRRVLETDDIGADTDFFELGGDSLLATRVLSAIAKRSGIELTFDDFVVSPTPSALVKQLGRAQS